MNAKQYLKTELDKAGKGEKFKQVWDLVSHCDDIQDIRSRFSPQAFPVVKKTWEIWKNELETEWNLEQAIAEADYECTTWRDDEVLDEVDAFAVVYENQIIVIANQTGMGQRIPQKNRRYIGKAGDMRWAFPLSEFQDILNCSAISFVLNEVGSRIR